MPFVEVMKSKEFALEKFEWVSVEALSEWG
jgi:hypothetical protein